MKILLFNSLYYPNITGGAELSTQLLAEGLKSKGIEPVVICTAEQNRMDFINGVKVYYLRTPNLYWLCRNRQQNFLKKILWHSIDSCNFAIKKQVQKIIDLEKPDIAHTNNLAGLSVYLWKLLNKNHLPIVHTIRDLYLLCPRSNMFKHGRPCRGQCLGCKLFSFPRKALSRYVDEAVGISRFILDFHLRGGYFPKAATSVIPNPLPANGGVAGERKLSKQGRLRFGFVGSLSEHKGIELLLQQFSQLDADLVVFGKSLVPDYQRQLELKYNRPNILFKGWESDIAKIYRDMDVLIVPSLWNEAFGRVVIEAFSFGIPVICSNKGALPELIEQGITGWVYDSDNAAQLRKAVEYVINKPQIVSQMSGDCIEQAGRFAVDAVTEKYIEAFSRVLDK